MEDLIKACKGLKNQVQVKLEIKRGNVKIYISNGEMAISSIKLSDISLGHDIDDEIITDLNTFKNLDHDSLCYDDIKDISINGIPYNFDFFDVDDQISKDNLIVKNLKIDKEFVDIIDNNNGNYFFRGLNIDIKNRKMMSTDSYMMIVKDINIEKNIDVDRLILPQDAIKQFKNKAVNILFIEDKKLCVIQNSSIRVVTPIIDAGSLYPDYMKIIFENNDFSKYYIEFDDVSIKTIKSFNKKHTLQITTNGDIIEYLNVNEPISNIKSNIKPNINNDIRIKLKYIQRVLTPKSNKLEVSINHEVSLMKKDDIVIVISLLK